MKQGRKPEVPGLCTREETAGRAVAAGTICHYPHCVALLTPTCWGGARVGVWLVLEDDERIRNQCGASLDSLVDFAVLGDTMLMSGMRLTTAHEILRPLFTSHRDTYLL